jgi:hypothetical protein
MKVYFYYIPLMFVGYALLDSEQALVRFGNLHLVIIVIIVSLGIIQVILGQSFLNPQNLAEDIRSSGDLYRTAPISGVRIYRPNGLFVSHGRYADFLLVAWIMVLGFSSYFLLRSRRGSVIAFVGLIVTFAGCLLSGSRGNFMWTLIGVAVTGSGLLWGMPWREGRFRRVFRMGFRTAVGIVLAIILLMVTYPEALLGRIAVYSETLSPYSRASELSYRTIDYPLAALLAAFSSDRWAYGYGTGTASLGVQYVARIFKVRPTGVNVESGYGTLILELGIVGLVLWLVLGSSIVLSVWRVVKRLKGTPYFPVAFVILWYAFQMFFLATIGSFQAYQDFLLNAYLWLLLGMLFKLPAIQPQIAEVRRK